MDFNGAFMCYGSLKGEIDMVDSMMDRIKNRIRELDELNIIAGEGPVIERLKTYWERELALAQYAVHIEDKTKPA